MTNEEFNRDELYHCRICGETCVNSEKGPQCRVCADFDFRERQTVALEQIAKSLATLNGLVEDGAFRSVVYKQAMR